MSYLASLTQPIFDITSDSRAVTQGSLFLAYPGVAHDGRNYIQQAIDAGASAIFWEKSCAKNQPFEWQENWLIENLGIEHLKQKAGEIAAEFYEYPSQKCSIVGVTGTNGKTSVSQWVAQCLNWLGKKVAVMGTIGNGFIDAQQDAVNTTPDAVLLQKMLANYVQEGAEAVAMEVSSHGLDQGRLNGTDFDIAVFTNLSRDHLDYHQTMEAYADAKSKLFDWPSLKMAVINRDDAFGKKLIAKARKAKQNFLSYGLASTHIVDEIDIYAANLTLDENGVVMDVHTPQGAGKLQANVIGEFNAYNLLAVLGVLLSLEIKLSEALVAIGHIHPVAGRMQQCGGGKQPLVVIDYAHTPDALEKVLATLRKQLPHDNNASELVCVFGCGGDRDAGKRPLMGGVVAKYADVMVVTSDNPRSEDPQQIIQEIVQGLSRPVVLEVDRERAIMQAIRHADPGDIVLIAGKGHEQYQEVLGVRNSFSDEAVARQALEKFHPIGVAA
jgi:UDP-N-acetylmuramyl-tripeptide synthetase